MRTSVKASRSLPIVMVAMIALASCAAPVTPPPIPTMLPTQTATKTFEPTWTPDLSATRTPGPTFTPPFAPGMATVTPMLLATTSPTPSPASTPTAPVELACKYNWQSPGNYIQYKPNRSFTVGWNVTNTGTAAWDPESVEFTYLSGRNMYQYPLVRLQARVAPGQSVTLSVPMRAPRNSTMYTTTWSLRRRDTYFCPLRVTIYVE